jgi:DNA mismatch repair ATPase MutS
MFFQFVSRDMRFVLITGPNAAGKSTYIKQVCLLQILAQIGCYVPAKAAVFVPRRHIFSRIGHNDDLGDNLSSFALEVSLPILYSINNIFRCLKFRQCCILRMRIL